MRKALLVLVCAWLLVGSLGCDILFAGIPEFVLMRYVQAWADADAPRAALGGATGRTGNGDVDAVLGTGNLVGNALEADKLAEQGVAEGDPAKIDQAIANRPGAWYYRVSRAALAVEQNDVTTFKAQLEQAKAHQVSNGDSETSLAKRTIKQLQPVADRKEKTWQSRGQCEAVYREIATQNGVLYQSTRDMRYSDAFRIAQQSQSACSSIAN